MDGGDHNFVLTLSDFDAIKYIGVGGYGKVFLVYDRYSHKHLGMKVVPKRKLRLPKWVKLFEEQRIMRLLEDCPWAVKLQGSFEDSLNFYMVMQYAAGGDLLQRLRRQRRFKPSAVRQIFAELVLAVQELHKRRIMHRDIKLENILLDKDGHALLADFGLSIGFDAETRVWNDMVGTMGYAAPELIDAKYTYHSYEVDIFSLGVCVYMLLVGAMPFGNEERMKFEDVAERTMHQPAAYPDDVDACTRDLFDRMLAKDPRQRITIPDIKAHPYFDHMSVVESSPYL
ncbi:hypothetical protein PHLGIDRAFT_73927 [Phlebiopsis gigantea 11061_1 CR5-6]|uniref:Protein kinase domain-containing protein n=1 Tax=Phlebiopsis gigantea (strain 11061_1 CR5-6) TaxID=745531 RepID=A0A0C3S8V9_PHLG1|nr:hypothetical protein PHLGIDRAFT_73927 [Phlebiopsis gigantea 11061_1 CR5-6]